MKTGSTLYCFVASTFGIEERIEFQLAKGYSPNVFSRRASKQSISRELRKARHTEKSLVLLKGRLKEQKRVRKST